MASAPSNSGRIYGSDQYGDFPLQEERQERRRSSQASSTTSTRDPEREQQYRERQRASNGNRGWIEAGRAKWHAIKDMAEQARDATFDVIEEEVGESVDHARKRMRDVSTIDLGLAKVNLKRNVEGGKQVTISSPKGKYAITGKQLSDDAETFTTEYKVGSRKYIKEEKTK